MHEIHCLITGTVQKVGFRDYVQASADSLQLSGWVKNLADRAVEVVAQGDQSVLKEFIEYLHEGSSLAEVTGVAVEWSTAKEPYDDFSVRYDS